MQTGVKQRLPTRRRISRRTNSRVVLFSNTIVKGVRCDVAIADGRIQSIAPPNTLTVTDPNSHLMGGSLTSHFAEPHVHLDAALLGARLPNRSGTLVEGIRNWATLLSLIHI